MHLNIPYYSVVKDRIIRTKSRKDIYELIWWSGPGLNRQPPACKADALPIELPPRSARPNFIAQISPHYALANAEVMVGLDRVELSTSPLSGARSTS
jgi:hypothetical protein